MKRKWVGVAILAIGTLLTIKVVDKMLPTPPFLISIQEAMSRNKKFTEQIGGSTGYEFYNAKLESDLVTGDTAEFYVKLLGKGDGAYVKVTGKYYRAKTGEIHYAIADTTLQQNCL